MGSRVRVPYAPLFGSLAQLNRASDYGSEGYRFESYRSHNFFGSLAQLNRASDYGSEGYRFESYRSHTEMEVDFYPILDYCMISLS